MKENFLQSLNSYADALEQKMDSLEKRVAELEQQLHNSVQENEQTRAKLGRLEEMLLSANQQLASLQLDTPVPQRPAAPKELELNLEPEPIQEPKPIEEPIIPAAPIVEMEPIEEPVVEESVIEEPIDEEPVAEEPMVEQPVIEEPVAEAPVEESIAEALSLEDLPTIDSLEAEPLPMDADGVVALDGNAMPDLVAIQPLEDLPVAEPAAPAAPVAEPVAEPVAAPVVEPVAAPVAAPVAPAAPVAEAPVAPQPAARPNMYGPQVADIRQAISLGDRFLFQRELFGQSGEKLQKTLDAINQMSSFDQALDYLDQNFNWDKEATAYNLFITALHRRFG